MFWTTLVSIFRGGHRDDWLKRLTEKDVPAAPINTLDEVFADPQVREYGFPVDVEHPKAGKTKLTGSHIKMCETQPEIRTPAPLLGQHNEEVYGSLLGLSGEELNELSEQNVI